ncbi:phosphohexomutase domain-containing protein [Cucumibacter marinus]|uniref:phosphomannomutase/phosphoglucomutase n=1 Tax=Cucumibacter marinus TaxID=1121252 RepID=UPI00040B7CA2|nr:phosphomannomutase/phosphoglucomutase [Cucumibacter marinus]
MNLSAFKSYDVRGPVPEALDTDLARAIGLAYVAEFKARQVVIGRDIRHESEELATALAEGLVAGGADVLDIGLCGTEEVYFAAFSREAAGVDGGIMVTASHNPKGHNGMKFVGRGARPIGRDTGLGAIRARIEAVDLPLADTPGVLRHHADKSDYIAHLLGYVDVAHLPWLKLVADPGNGCAGPVVELLRPHLPFSIELINGEPDGDFPNGVPNPLLPTMRDLTAGAVRAFKADLGIAWDGDFDRCFFFDETGRFIEGYYLVGLLAESLLTKTPGAPVVHDPRLTWNTVAQVEAAGGKPVQSPTGHAFMKQAMRQADAIYGGEMSAHHYFREFGYCDSGMIPWLLVTELMGRTGKTLAELVDARMAAFPCSGEINFRVVDTVEVLERIEAHYAGDHPAIDRMDGFSAAFPDWRFNVRASNTEPLLRLNVETRGDPDAVARHVETLEALIGGERA